MRNVNFMAITELKEIKEQYFIIQREQQSKNVKYSGDGGGSGKKEKDGRGFCEIFHSGQIQKKWSKSVTWKSKNQSQNWHLRFIYFESTMAIGYGPTYINLALHWGRFIFFLDLPFCFPLRILSTWNSPKVVMIPKTYPEARKGNS